MTQDEAKQAFSDIITFEYPEEIDYNPKGHQETRAARFVDEEAGVVFHGFMRISNDESSLSVTGTPIEQTTLDSEDDV